MGANSGRLATGLLLLIGVWIGVYWMYEPSKPKITLDPAETLVERGSVEEGQPGAGLPAMMKVEGTSPPAAKGVEPRTIAVVPPEFVEYTVQAGDTFESISLKFYKTTEHAGAITRANGLGDAGRLLTPGRTIRVARDPNNVQGVAVGPGPGSVLPREVEVPPPAEQKPVPEVKVARPPRTYTVQSGDSLSKIAKRFYGDASAWERIYEANKGSMKGPHDLKLGAVLVIPE